MFGIFGGGKMGIPVIGGLVDAIGDTISGRSPFAGVAQATNNLGGAQRRADAAETDAIGEAGRRATRRAQLMRDYLNVTGGVRDGRERSPSPVGMGRVLDAAGNASRGVKLEGLDSDVRAGHLNWDDFFKQRTGSRAPQEPAGPKLMGPGGGAPDNRNYARR